MNERRKRHAIFYNWGPEESYYMNIPDKDPAIVAAIYYRDHEVFWFWSFKAIIIFNAMMLSEDDAKKHFKEYKKILEGF